MKLSKRNERASQIIEAAFRLIKDKGYNNLTMQGLSTYANMSKGGINHYFKNKEEILIAVLEELDRKLFKTIDDKIENPEDPEDMLRKRCSGGFEMAKADPTLLYVLIDFTALSKNNSQYSEIIKHFFEKYRYLASVGVKGGITSGVYKNIIPEEFGVVMIAVWFGIWFQWALEQKAFNYDRVTKIVEDMMFNYLEGKKEKFFQNFDVDTN